MGWYLNAGVAIITFTYLLNSFFLNAAKVVNVFIGCNRERRISGGINTMMCTG
jgi:hypothetical protein